MGDEINVLVTSLDHVTTTILRNGKEIHFKNSLTKVTEKEAEEMINRPNHRYILYDPSVAGQVRTPKPSFENLEKDYIELMQDNRNLAKMRNWITEKYNEVSQNLLNFQRQQGQPLVPGQEQVMSPQSTQVELGAEQGEGPLVQDIETIPVDGEGRPISPAEQMPDVIERARAALGNNQ